jgi:hypothetical protein
MGDEISFMVVRYVNSITCNRMVPIFVISIPYTIFCSYCYTLLKPVVLVGMPEGKRQLGRPRRRWEDNIKMDLQEVGGVVGTGWSWLRIGTGGGHLWVG